MPYGKIRLYDHVLIGDPAPLPAELVGLAEESLIDLSWSTVATLQPYGYWLVEETIPTYDARIGLVGSGFAELTVDIETHRVAGVREILTNPAPEPFRVSKIEFSRLFSFAERVSIEYMKKAVAAQSPSDFGDPTNLPMQMLAVVLTSFDLPSEFIELDNADTIVAVGTVLVGAGVLTSDRAARILTGLPPL
jgi:hypothetical protein